MTACSADGGDRREPDGRPSWLLGRATFFTKQPHIGVISKMPVSPLTGDLGQNANSQRWQLSGRQDTRDLACVPLFLARRLHLRGSESPFGPSFAKLHIVLSVVSM